MVHYTAEVLWLRGDQGFLGNRYSRKHVLRFDGGIEVPGSSSPLVVPAPLSDAAAVDPEEAFVAALAGSHMLCFLTIADKRQFRVDRYFDTAQGVMEKNAAGRPFISVVTLRPQVTFSGDLLPSRYQIDQMHYEAHDECFIACSVKTEVRCEPLHLSLDLRLDD